MADNSNPDLTEVLEQLNDELVESRKHRALTAKEAKSTDKALLKELKARREAANRPPEGFAKRVGRRAVGGVAKAASGAIGNAVGAIPVVGTILKVLGKEFSNSRFDKKVYLKSLKQRRKYELREMDRMAKIQAKLKARAERNEARDSGTGGSSDRAPTTNQAVVKLSDAADRLAATAISMTPAIETFHETVEKMAEVVDSMYEAESTSKVRDQQALEYLYAIDILTQEHVSIAERNEGTIQTLGKDIGNIKWHMARANGSVGRIEKLYADRDPSKVEVSSDPTLVKDVGTIKWHIARANGSVGRIEKMLMTAADDRLHMLETQKESLKLQQKQIDTTDEGNTIGVIGAITNLFGGAGALAAGAAMVTLGVGAAAALGYEIGKVIRDVIPDNDFTREAGDQFGMAIDRLLAWFGDDEAEARLAVMEKQKNLDRATNGDAALGNSQDGNETHGEQWQQDYASENGRFDFKQRHIIKDPNSWWGHRMTDPMYEHEAQAKEQELSTQANKLGQQSAEIADAKNAPTVTPASTQINAPTASNVTNNTVTQQPLNANSDRNAGRSLREPK